MTEGPAGGPLTFRDLTALQAQVERALDAAGPDPALWDRWQARVAAGITAAELSAMLMDRLRQQLRYAKVLLCARDVSDRLRSTLPGSQAGARQRGPGMALQESLTAISIVITGDVPPGWFRLTEHDHCAVDAEREDVSHAGCTVVSEGILDPAAN